MAARTSSGSQAKLYGGEERWKRTRTWALTRRATRTAAASSKYASETMIVEFPNVV
jgi:hypothetical protein